MGSGFCRWSPIAFRTWTTTAAAAAPPGAAVRRAAAAAAITAELAGMLARLGELTDTATADTTDDDRTVDAARIDAIGLLERIQAAAAATQAALSVGFGRSQVATQQQQVLRDPRAVGRGIADQLALACRVSPTEGSRRLGHRPRPAHRPARHRRPAPARTDQLLRGQPGRDRDPPPRPRPPPHRRHPDRRRAGRVRAARKPPPWPAATPTPPTPPATSPAAAPPGPTGGSASAPPPTP